MTNEHETLVRDALAPYGITDVSFVRFSESDQIAILISETTDIEVTQMIANDILRPAPVRFDLYSCGAGETMVFKGWDGCGGAMFIGRIASRLDRAERNYRRACEAADALERVGEVIEADKIRDFARCELWAAQDELYRSEAA